MFYVTCFNNKFLYSTAIYIPETKFNIVIIISEKDTIVDCCQVESR